MSPGIWASRAFRPPSSAALPTVLPQPISPRLTAARWAKITCALSRVSEPMPQPSPSPTASPRLANQRGAARLAAVQALYQMDVGRQSLEDTLSQFDAHMLGREVEGEQYLPADADFFRQIVTGVIRSQLDIDPTIDNALSSDWPVGRIDATLRAI